MASAVDVRVKRKMSSSHDALWATLQDLSRLADWLAFASEVNDVSANEAAPGVTYSVKPHRSYEPTTHWEIESVDPPTRQVHRSEMPMISGVTSTVELEDQEDGVVARVHWRGEPSGFFGRLMRPIFQKRITQNWEKSLEELDRVAGGDVPSS